MMLTLRSAQVELVTDANTLNAGRGALTSWRSGKTSGPLAPRSNETSLVRGFDCIRRAGIDWPTLIQLVIFLRAQVAIRKRPHALVVSLLHKAIRALCRRLRITRSRRLRAGLLF